MSDYGDQCSSETKSESAASPLTTELNSAPASAAAVAAPGRLHTSSSGVSSTHAAQFTSSPSPLMFAAGAHHPAHHHHHHHQLHAGALGSLVDPVRACPSLNAAGGLDDDGGFLAINVAAAAAAAAGTFGVGYNRL